MNLINCVLASALASVSVVAYAKVDLTCAVGPENIEALKRQLLDEETMIPVTSHFKNCTHRRWIRHAASAAIAMALCAATALARAQADGEPAWEALRQGAVLLVRHANAPGVGDPADFKLGDCRTQRNLDQTGREQAKRLGDQFVSRQIAVGAVLVSQWCRTKDTAELAFPNRAQEDASFNSFFGDSASQPAQTAAALNTLKRWKGPGALVVVTHQVNITALTGVVPASSEGVVVRPKADGIEVVGRVPP